MGSYGYGGDCEKVNRKQIIVALLDGQAVRDIPGHTSTIYYLRSLICAELKQYGLSLKSGIPDAVKQNIIETLGADQKTGPDKNQAKRDAIVTYIINHQNQLLSAESVAEKTGNTPLFVKNTLGKELKLSAPFPTTVAELRDPTLDQPYRLKNRSSTQYVLFSIKYIRGNKISPPYSQLFNGLSVFASRTRWLPFFFMALCPGDSGLISTLDFYISEYIAAYNRTNPLPKTYKRRIFVPELQIEITEKTMQKINIYNQFHDRIHIIAK